ncbi:MAG: DEAD/DEAH box helicase [Fusobacterium sp.]|nr:DEAD/DEAH box helicase [Fusobacterium sp.]
MKFNLESLENIYANKDYSRNFAHAKKHFSEFKDFLAELSVNTINKTRIVYRATTFMYGYENNPIISSKEDGTYISSYCDCKFHAPYDPCAHVWMLAKYCVENEIEPPFYFKDENSENPNVFFEKTSENLYISSKLSSSKSWLKNLIQNEILEDINSEKENFIELYPCLELQEYFDDSELHLYIRFKIGNEKLYFLKNIENNLFVPLENNSIKSFGKNLKVNMNYENFTEFGKVQIDFLKRNREHISGEHIYINEYILDEIYELYQENLTEIKFMEQDFEIELDMTPYKNNYILTLKNKFSKKFKARKKSKFRYYDLEDELKENFGEYQKFYITNKRIYMFDENLRTFVYMSLNFHEIKLYNKLYHSPSLFSKEDIKEILFLLNNKLENIKISDNILNFIEEYENFMPQIYLDLDQDENLIIKLSYEKEYISLNLKILVDILKSFSSNIFNSLEEKNKISEVFILDNNKLVDKFFNETLTTIKKYSEIFFSSSIKNMNIKRRVNLSVGVKVASNLLEINFASTDLENGELLDFLNQYRQKKKYYRLKNGETILLDVEQLEFIDNLVKDLDIRDTELKKKKIKLPMQRMYQLSTLSDEYINLEADKKFDDLFKENKIEILPKYKNILRSYQISGVEWLLKLRAMNLSGILADDMGLGKTLQVISYLETIKNSEKFNCDKPSIIITPASLILNWENEFKKFNSDLKITLIYGDKKNRFEKIANIKDEIIITSYDYLKRDIDKYENISFDTIILDEAQYIKTHKTKVARTVKKLVSNNRIALSGTPIENNLAEIWSIFDFLMPNYLFNYEYFSKNYEKPIVLNNDNKITKRLKKMLEPFILRRIKQDVLTELPEKIEETYFVELSSEEKKVYESNLILIQKQLGEKISESNNKIEILAMLTKLRQLCIDQRLVYENITATSSKINSCIDLIKHSIENKQKIILFSSFTTVLDLIIEECQKEKISHLLLTGKTPKEKRNQMVNEFQNEDVPLFLISLKAGGTGLNLTKASVVIHIDPWWNISAQNQATDRAYRIGQENKVQVFNLITKNTIEEKILFLQEKKKNLSDTFVENSSGNFASLTKDELLDLFKI